MLAISLRAWLRKAQAASKRYPDTTYGLESLLLKGIRSSKNGLVDGTSQITIYPTPRSLKVEPSSCSEPAMPGPGLCGPDTTPPRSSAHGLIGRVPDVRARGSRVKRESVIALII